MKRRVAQLMTFAVAVLLARAAIADPARDPATAIVHIIQYDEDPTSKKEVQVGVSSGFVVHPNGWVITTKHSINPSTTPGKKRIWKGQVGGYSGEHRSLHFRAADDDLDIALLQFSSEAGAVYPYISFASEPSYEPSDAIVAFGFAFGKEMWRRPGHIGSYKDVEGIYGTNAGLARGMSGGPVLDKSGEAIGVIFGGFRGQNAYDFFTPTAGAVVLSRIPRLPTAASGVDGALQSRAGVVCNWLTETLGGFDSSGIAGFRGQRLGGTSVTSMGEEYTSYSYAGPIPVGQGECRIGSFVKPGGGTSSDHFSCTLGGVAGKRGADLSKLINDQIQKSICLPAASWGEPRCANGNCSYSSLRGQQGFRSFRLEMRAYQSNAFDTTKPSIEVRINEEGTSAESTPSVTPTFLRTNHPAAGPYCTWLSEALTVLARDGLEVQKNGSAGPDYKTREGNTMMYFKYKGRAAPGRSKCKIMQTRDGRTGLIDDNLLTCDTLHGSRNEAKDIAIAVNRALEEKKCVPAFAYRSTHCAQSDKSDCVFWSAYVGDGNRNFSVSTRADGDANSMELETLIYGESLD